MLPTKSAVKRVRVSWIGFGLNSDWIKKWWPIVWRNNAKPFTQMKIAPKKKSLHKISLSNLFVPGIRETPAQFPRVSFYRLVLFPSVSTCSTVNISVANNVTLSI